MQPLPLYFVHNTDIIGSLNKDIGQCSNDCTLNNVYSLHKGTNQDNDCPYINNECEIICNKSQIICNNISINHTSNCIKFDNDALAINNLARLIFPRFDPQIDPNWHTDERTNSQKLFDIFVP